MPPFDSEGQFTRLHSWEDDRINDIEIVADSHDEEDNNFADGLSQTVLRDGRVAMTGNFNGGGFQIKNIGAATNDADAVTKEQLDMVDTRLSEVDESAIHLAGTETVTGVKTFDVSPLVPTAATDSNDTTTASTAFVHSIVGSGVYSSSASGNAGWVKLPSGLLVQWGQSSSSGTITFQKTYTIGCQVVGTEIGNTYSADYHGSEQITSVSKTGFSWNGDGSTGIRWIAVGI